MVKKSIIVLLLLSLISLSFTKNPITQVKDGYDLVKRIKPPKGKRTKVNEIMLDELEKYLIISYGSYHTIFVV